MSKIYTKFLCACENKMIKNRFCFDSPLEKFKYFKNKTKICSFCTRNFPKVIENSRLARISWFQNFDALFFVTSCIFWLWWFLFDHNLIQPFQNISTIAKYICLLFFWFCLTLFSSLYLNIHYLLFGKF
jgi:hypothetical protein